MKDIKVEKAVETYRADMIMLGDSIKDFKIKSKEEFVLKTEYIKLESQNTQLLEQVNSLKKALEIKETLINEAEI